MKVHKKILYDRAVLSNKVYRDTGDRVKAIESSVIAGAYYGCGGKRRINIDHPYLIIMVVASMVVKSKDKFGNRLKNNMQVMNRVLAEMSGGSLEVIFNSLNGDNSRLAGRIKRADIGTTLLVGIISNRITDEFLIKAACVIMELYSNSGMEDGESKRAFKTVITEMISLAG